jgi:LysM repeat protein
VNFLQRSALIFSLTALLFTGSGILFADDLVHIVGRGETIYSISRSYSVSAEDLMKANNITDPSRLQAGSRLKIPSNVTASVSENTITETRLVDYRVVRGDTLYSIARTNGISLQALQEMNRFSSNHVLKVGDIVKVPARNTETTSGLYALRWPVAPKDISYMTGQMGVVVEGEYIESVKCIAQGNVISAGPWRKFGKVVIVETSGGYFYMYGGLETLSVSVGDKISPGTEVGKLGINSVSEKPQLFFMVFRSDTPVDPASAPRAGANVKA